MIRTDRDPVDYKHRSDSTGAGSYGDPTRLTGFITQNILTITWAKIWTFASGVKVTTTLTDTGWVVDVETPWGDFSYTDAAGSVNVLLEWDDLQLTYPTCDTFHFEFSELRIKINGVLEDTISAQFENGETCDKRLNCSVGESFTNFSGHSIGAPPCEAHREDQLEFSNSAAGTHNWGWSWYDVDEGDWVEDGVQIYGWGSVAMPACTCLEPLDEPEITSDGSFDFLNVSSAFEDASISNERDREGNCASGAISPTICREWRLDYIYTEIDTKTTGTITSSGLNTLRVVKQGVCGINSVSSDNTTSHPIAYSLPDFHLDRTESHVYCQETIQIGDCEHLPPPVCGEGDLVPPATIACTASKDLQVTWPDAVECCDTFENPSCLETRSGLSFKADVDGSGNIWVHRANRYMPVPVWDSEVVVAQGTDPQLCEDFRKALILVFEDGGDTYECVSFDDGETWTTPTMDHTNWLHPRVRSSPLGTVIRAGWIDASDKIEATLQYAGDATQSSAFFFKNSGGVDLQFENDSFDIYWAWDGSCALYGVFRIEGESVTSDWISYDDGRTWLRVT